MPPKAPWKTRCEREPARKPRTRRAKVLDIWKPSLRWFSGRRSAGADVDHLGVVAAAEQPGLAAGVGVRGGRVLHGRPVALGAGETGGPPGLRMEGHAAAAGASGAVGDCRVVAAAGEG